MASLQDLDRRFVHLAACLVGIGSLLIVILMPLSFEGINYHEVGLRTQRSTQKTYKDKVWGEGNHMIGPDYMFLKYPITSQHVDFSGVRAWSFNSGNVSAGAGLSLDVSVQYRLRRASILQLYELVGTSFERLIETRLVEAIKNTAPYFSFDQFITRRLDIEDAMRRNCSAVLDSLSADVIDLQLHDVTFPEKVQAKNLQAAIQQEDNDRELFFQEAAVVRSQTQVLRQQILNQANVLSEQARAEGFLVRERAKAYATQARGQAHNSGLASLYEALNVTQQKHKASLDELIRLNERMETDRQTTTWLDFSHANAVSGV